MLIIGIDPGPEQSAYAVIDTDSGFPGKIIAFGKGKENNVLEFIYKSINGYLGHEKHLCIEMPASYGMAVGRSVFETCAQVGRFEISLNHNFNINKTFRLYRKSKNDNGIPSICMSICKNNKSGDSNIRAAIIDLYPATGGGKVPQIGTKKEPGPLYGVSKDVWAALAVALTYQIYLENIY